MKKLIIMLAIVVSGKAYSLVDLSQYNLKPSQIETVRKLESTGKYDEAFIIKFAEVIHNRNIADERRANTYIPPYTQDELYATIAWARGAAFSSFADLAGYEFLGEEYRADCPNVGLFRFGRATGTEFIPADVTRETNNQFFELQRLYSTLDRQAFREKFIELAKRHGFDIYLVSKITD